MITYKHGEKPVPDYKIDSFLGEGGYGCVYKVVNVKTGIPKALKVITLKDTQGYKEYTALALFKEIRHPNLVPIEHYWLLDEKGQEIKFGEDESLNIAGRGTVTLLILLGLGDRSLADRLKECLEKKQSGIPLSELMDYMDGVAKAIDFLNTPKTIGARENVAIQHGDIKPGNVLLVGGDSIQVGDYGLAQAISVTPETGKSRTTTGSMAGTPEYAAPEQVGGKASRNSDQFSLAISFYELRTGRLPFDDQANRYACLAVDGLDFSLVSPFEQEVMQKATHRQFAQRYTSCKEFVKALRKAHSKAGLIDRSMEFQALPDSIQAPIKPPPTPPAYLDRLKPGAEDFVQGFQLVKCLGKHTDEQLWQVLRIDDSQPFLLKIILGTNPSYAFEQYNSLSKLHSITYDKILNLENLWVADRAGREVSSDQIKQPNSLTDKIVLVLIEAVKTTLEDHVLAMKKSRYNDRLKLKRKWFDVAKNICMGTDYWNKHCYRAYHALNPASILVNMYDQIKIDSAGVGPYLREGTPSQLADSHSFDAPEVFEGKYYDQSDQYSLTMIYYWLCIGKPFFSADLPPEDIKDYLRDNPIDFSAQFPEEAEVLARATLLDPQDRFPDSITFLEAFEDALMITGIGRPIKTPSRPPVVAEPVVAQPVSAKLSPAPAPVAIPVTPAPPGPGPRTPRSVEGGTIQFTADDIEQARVNTPKPTPEIQRKTPRGEEWRRLTEKDPPLMKTPKTKPVKVEPVLEEPIEDISDLDDDEPQRKTNWIFWGIMLILLICVFTVTLIILRAYDSPVTLLGLDSIIKGLEEGAKQDTDSGPPVTTQGLFDIGLSTISMGIAKGGEVGITIPPPPPGFQKEFAELKNMISGKPVVEAGKIIETESPKLKERYASDNDAVSKITALQEFVKLLTQDKLFEKPVAEQVKWIDAYKKAKSDLDDDALFADHTKTVESDLAKRSENLIDSVSDKTLWTENRKYFEAVEPFADAELKNLSKWAIIECDIETGKQGVKIPDVASDASYPKYVTLRLQSKNPKQDFAKTLPLLREYLLASKPDPPSLNSYRQLTARSYLDTIIASCRIKDKPFAAFDEKKRELAGDSLELLLSITPQDSNAEKIRIRTTCELAMIKAEKDPAASLKKFDSIQPDKLGGNLFSEPEQTEAFISYMTLLSKEPGYDQQKAACSAKLIDKYLRKKENVDFSTIHGLCIKTLSNGIAFSSIDGGTARDLSQQLLNLALSVLKDASEIQKYMDDMKQVDLLVRNVCGLSLKFNPQNSLARIYSMLFESSLLSFSSNCFLQDKKDMGAAIAKLDETYIQEHLPSHYSVHLIRSIKNYFPLKEEMEKQLAGPSVRAHHNQCLSEVKLLIKSIEAVRDQPTEFEKLACYTFTAYIYNVLANNSTDQDAARQCLDDSIVYIEKAQKENGTLQLDQYGLLIHTIKGISFEDQAWILRDEKTAPSAYSKALEEYQNAFEKTAKNLQQRSLATVNLCRCIYRYSDFLKAIAQTNTVSDASREYRSKLGQAEARIKAFLRDKDNARQFQKNTIEVLFFYAKLITLQIPEYPVFSNIEQMREEVNRLKEPIQHLAEAYQMSQDNGSFYLPSILVDLVTNLEAQSAFIVDPMSKSNIFRISKDKQLDPILLALVNSNLARIKKLGDECPPELTPVNEYCKGVLLLFQSNQAGLPVLRATNTAATWLESDELDSAFDCFRKALSSLDKDLQLKAVNHLYEIADIRLAYSLKGANVPGAVKQKAKERYILAINKSIDVEIIRKRGNFKTARFAAKSSSDVYKKDERLTESQPFMLTLAVDCMVRAIDLDESVISDPKSSEFGHYTVLYERVRSNAIERAKLDSIVKRKWSGQVPSHIKALMNNSEN